MVKNILLSIFFFLPVSVFAAVRTGPITPNVINHFYPEMNPVGNAFRVPVSWAGIQGTAEIGSAGTLGSLLDYAKRGLGGPALNAALLAATVCFTGRDSDPFDLCHGDAPSTMPPTVNPENIYPAVQSGYADYYYGGVKYGTYHYPLQSDSCIGLATRLNSSQNDFVYTFSSIGSHACVFTRVKKSSGASGGTVTISDFAETNLSTQYNCPDGGVLTDSVGVPMAITGRYCVQPANYECNTSYAINSDYTACELQEQTLTDEQAADLLKPQLLNYYADQLFRDKNLQPITEPFEQDDTIFDPDMVPSNFPTSWETFKQWVDWVRNGKAQTSDPLAPNYLTPQQYDYTNNYITNNDTSNVTNNTSSAYPTTDTVSSAEPMTQEQYEESTKKAEQEKSDALTSVGTSLSTIADTYNQQRQDIINKIGSPDAPPADMPNPFVWAWPTGNCQGFHISLNLYVPIIGTLNIEKDVNEYCEPYETYIHPAFFWFFNLLTALYLFRLWDKTAIDVMKI